MLQLAVVHQTPVKGAWVKQESLPLNDHLIWETVDDEQYDFETSFRAVASRHLDVKWKPFIAPTVPWRFVIVQPRSRAGWVDVHFGWHHVVCDGTSGRVLLESLLRNLATDAGTAASVPALARGDRILTLPEPQVPPSPLKVINFTFSPKFVASSLLKLVHHPRSKYGYSWIPADMENVKTDYRCLSLDPAQTRSLLDACKAHKTTLTGVLEALLFLAVAKHVPATNAKVFKSGMPISMRRFVTKAAQERHKFAADTWVRNCVGEVMHQWDEPLVEKVRGQFANSKTSAGLTTELEETLWETAAQARKNITEHIAKDNRNDLAGLMFLIDDWPKYFRDEMKHPRELTWVLSNIGSFEGGHDGPLPAAPAPASSSASTADEEATVTNGHSPKEGSSSDKWTMENILWLGSAFAGYGPACGLRVTGIKHRGLSMTWNWQKGMSPDNVFDKIADDLQVWLREIGHRVKD
jgi:hypothetical protein